MLDENLTLNQSELDELYQEMEATAVDLGMELLSPVDSITREMCEELQNRIEKFRHGIEEQEELAITAAAATPLEEVSDNINTQQENDEMTDITADATIKKKKGKFSANRKVAKVAVPKKAKVAVAKKARVPAVKKAAVSKKATKSQASGADRIFGNAEYIILPKGEKNPYREDTSRFKMYQKLAKHSSLEKFKKAGGETWALRIAVRDGFAKVTKSS